MNIQRSAPLQEPTFFILLSLASGIKHGYAIMKDVAALSEGKVRMGTGTLYGALSRLLEQALIERIDLPEDNGNDSGGRLRKAYRLTSAGRSLLQVETDRMRSLVTTASLRLEEGNI
ncbi:MAG: helix-turn-helix transcriptional regulator [Anaerolineaceae bacterium]|nr:helix-turn-helix transcriptional regulator [Anaerolineaceae bacterium]